jgi:hypothetical protein
MARQDQADDRIQSGQIALEDWASGDDAMLHIQRRTDTHPSWNKGL